MLRYAALLIVVFLALFSVPGSGANAMVYDSKAGPIKVTRLATGLAHPWGMDFLDDKTLIVTEREGNIRLVSLDGIVSDPLTGLPDIWVSGQGGVLDVLVDPDYVNNGLIYFSYAEPGKGGASTAVARAVLNRENLALNDVRVIFRQLPKSDGGRHFGSRLVFSPDGHLYITTGDRGERDRAQDFTINRAQVIRIWPDGTIPDDNPFVGRKGYLDEVWSYGHRNPQGAARHPVTGKLWIHEHGARGGDEINIPAGGKNYGWPVIAYGIHYFGGKIGEGTHKEGMEQPIYYWDPSIAPSGMDFYTGDRFPAWKGNLFVGALKDRMLVRLTLDGEKVIAEERLLQDMDERIRAVKQGQDGYLYLLIDDDPGSLLRLEPAR